MGDNADRVRAKAATGEGSPATSGRSESSASMRRALSDRAGRRARLLVRENTVEDCDRMRYTSACTSTNIPTLISAASTPLHSFLSLPAAKALEADKAYRLPPCPCRCPRSTTAGHGRRRPRAGSVPRALPSRRFLPRLAPLLFGAAPGQAAGAGAAGEARGCRAVLVLVRGRGRGGGGR